MQLTRFCFLVHQHQFVWSSPVARVSRWQTSRHNLSVQPQEKPPHTGVAVVKGIPCQENRLLVPLFTFLIPVLGLQVPLAMVVFLWCRPLQQINSRSLFYLWKLQADKIIQMADSQLQACLVTKVLPSLMILPQFFWHLLPLLQSWLMAADTLKISALFESPWKCFFSQSVSQKSLKMLSRCVLKPHTRKQIFKKS